MPAETLVKILFRFYSDILDQETTETMWAEVIDGEKGYFQIDNIPFYVPKLAFGDVVWAEYSEEEGMLTYRKTVEYSGNSVIHVIMMDDKHEVDAIREIFTEMGCESEKINNYFTLEIPANMDYAPIKKKLDELAKNDVIDYAESSLSEKHQYKDFFL